MALAVVPLQKLHGESLIHFIEQRQGNVLFDRRVERLEWEGNRVRAVVLTSGERIACGFCISAIPAPAGKKLIQNSGLDDRIAIPDLGESPILSVYLWFEKPLSDEPFCCLQDCTYEWIFHRNNFMNPGEHRLYCVCLLVSAARRLQNRSREELVKCAIDDIHRTYPEPIQQDPCHALVFWEPHATFSATPAHVQKRLGSRTGLENLFLAGDWTQTGLPATIEGAVVSGNRASQYILT